MRAIACAMVVSMVLPGCAVPGAGAEDLLMAGELAASLEAGIASGEVRLSLHVSNLRATPVSFTFATSQRYDFHVEDAEGREVWRWSSDRMFAQVITEAELGPGESWTMEAVWPTGGRTGRYVAVGRVVSMDGGLEQRAAFDLP